MDQTARNAGTDTITFRAEADGIRRLREIARLVGAEELAGPGEGHAASAKLAAARRLHHRWAERGAPFPETEAQAEDLMRAWADPPSDAQWRLARSMIQDDEGLARKLAHDKAAVASAFARAIKAGRLRPDDIPSLQDLPPIGDAPDAWVPAGAVAVPAAVKFPAYWENRISAYLPAGAVSPLGSKADVAAALVDGRPCLAFRFHPGGAMAVRRAARGRQRGFETNDIRNFVLMTTKLGIGLPILAEAQMRVSAWFGDANTLFLPLPQETRLQNPLIVASGRTDGDAGPERAFDAAPRGRGAPPEGRSKAPVRDACRRPRATAPAASGGPRGTTRLKG